MTDGLVRYHDLLLSRDLLRRVERRHNWYAVTTLVSLIVATVVASPVSRAIWSGVTANVVTASIVGPAIAGASWMNVSETPRRYLRAFARRTTAGRVPLDRISATCAFLNGPVGECVRKRMNLTDDQWATAEVLAKDGFSESAASLQATARALT